MKLVSQLTPFTCVLACFESFLYDQGVFVSQAEILKSHVDLCINPHDEVKFGAMDVSRLRELAKRHAYISDILSNPTKEQIDEILRKSHGIICICQRFKDQDINHTIRLIQVQGEYVIFMNSQMFGACWDKVKFDELLSKWSVTFIHLFSAVGTSPASI